MKRIILTAAILLLLVSSCLNCETTDIENRIIIRKESYGRETRHYKIEAIADCRKRCISFVASTEEDFRQAFVGENLRQWRERIEQGAE
jgi:hypothetical protein